MQKQEKGFVGLEIYADTEYFASFVNLCQKQGLKVHEVLSEPINLLMKEYVQASKR